MIIAIACDPANGSLALKRGYRRFSTNGCLGFEIAFTWSTHCVPYDGSGAVLCWLHALQEPRRCVPTRKSSPCPGRGFRTNHVEGQRSGSARCHSLAQHAVPCRPLFAKRPARTPLEHPCR